MEKQPAALAHFRLRDRTVDVPGRVIPAARASHLAGRSVGGPPAGRSSARARSPARPGFRCAAPSAAARRARFAPRSRESRVAHSRLAAATRSRSATSRGVRVVRRPARASPRPTGARPRCRRDRPSCARGGGTPAISWSTPGASGRQSRPRSTRCPRATRPARSRRTAFPPRRGGHAAITRQTAGAPRGGSCRSGALGGVGELLAHPGQVAAGARARRATRTARRSRRRAPPTATRVGRGALGHAGSARACRLGELARKSIGAAGATARRSPPRGPGSIVAWRPRTKAASALSARRPGRAPLRRRARRRRRAATGSGAAGGGASAATREAEERGALPHGRQSKRNFRWASQPSCGSRLKPDLA